MELRQLGNLVDILTGSHEYGDYQGNREVKVLCPGGDLCDVLSLGWSEEDGCFVLCLDVEEP